MSTVETASIVQLEHLTINNGHGILLDKVTGSTLQDNEFTSQCVEHLRALPFVRHARLSASARRQRSGVAAKLAIETVDASYDLPCEIRRAHLGIEAAQFVVHEAKERAGLIVLAPTIGPGLGDLFEKESVNFVDALGNCHLRLTDRYIARIQGRKATEPVASERGLRAPAYRALFALLVRADLMAATSRAIASDAAVSPQTANALRHWLTQQGLVLKTRERWRWAPGRKKDAVALWLTGFTTVLAPHLTAGRYRAMERNVAELERRIEPLLEAACSWRYGGGAAAMRWTGHYRGDSTVIYVRDAPLELPKQLRFVRDASGPILLRQLPAAAAFESQEKRCVHPLLAYADLLSEGHERAREAAEEVRSRFLQDLEREP